MMIAVCVCQSRLKDGVDETDFAWQVHSEFDNAVALSLSL